MSYNQEALKGIFEIYEGLKERIDTRIAEFKTIWDNGTEDEIFAEFAFCIFTPQSKAKSCWQAVNNLLDKKMLYTAGAEEIAKEINLVRFRNKKGEYLVAAREFFKRNGKIAIKEILSQFDNDFEKREYIVKNIKGIGWKEGAHFLRNVGFADNLSILDRHILKNLAKLGVIEEVPETMTDKKYFEIEQKMINFSKEIKMEMKYLDFVLWYKEAGDVFK